MSSEARPLAVVTGASTGIGYELARCCAENGFDLVVAADEPATGYPRLAGQSPRRPPTLLARPGPLR